MNNLLHISNLRCAYGQGPTVLTVPELRIPRGRLIFVVGVSGGGKSTLLETIGLMNRTIQAGSTLRFNGGKEPDTELSDLWSAPINELDEFRKRHFSFIFQKTNLMPNFTCGENMLLPALFKGGAYAETKERVLTYMDRLGLERDIFNRNITNISGGQRQRLAFIRAMVADFSVLFGDEPTGNLDPNTAREVMHVLKTYLGKRNKTGIVVSHDIELACQFADLIVPITMVKNGEEVSSFGTVVPANIIDLTTENADRTHTNRFDRLQEIMK